MSVDLLALLIVGLLVIILVTGIIKAITGPRGGVGIASLTAFHDLQPKDK